MVRSRGGVGACDASRLCPGGTILLVRDWHVEKEEGPSRKATALGLARFWSVVYSLAFHRDLGILIIQTPNPLTSQTLADTFRQLITRTLREANVLIDGLPVAHVQFQSKR